MQKNPFTGSLEPWKVRLITSRAARRGFRGADLDEVVQRVAIALCRFRYDESRGSATERTAVTALVDRQLKYFHRSETRYRRRVTAASCHEEPLVDVRASHDESLDIQGAIADLPPLTQQICQLLASGLSVNEIAQQLGVGWHTIDRHVRAVRQRLEQLGLRPAPLRRKQEPICT